MPTAAETAAAARGADSVAGLRANVRGMMLADLERGGAGAGRSSYVLGGESSVNALHAASLTGRSLLYLTAGPAGGAAVRVEAPETGRGIGRTVELPDLTLDAVHEQATRVQQAMTAVPAFVEPQRDAVHEALTRVARAVWEPVLREWPDLARVALVPLGECALLPLFTAPVHGVPACARMDLTLVPSAKALLLAGLWPGTVAGETLVAADPWYGNGRISRTLDEARAVASVHGVRPRLLREAPQEAAGGTRQEAERVRALLGSLPGDVLPGGASPEGDLVDRIAEAAVVHVACHGALDDERPMDSVLCLGSPIPLAALLPRNLRPGATVVLSACRLGGIGRELTGEQLGFPGALLAMGAGSVTGALWAVPDRPATVELMADFHRRLAQAGAGPGGTSPSAALGRAVAEAARADVDVRVWAPFAHFGR